MDIKALRSEGLSIRAIAQRTGLSRNTVRRVLRGEHPMRVRGAERSSRLAEFEPYLKERFDAYGLSAVRLLAEIRGMGYNGSIQTVRRYLAKLKAPGVRLGQATLRYETPPGKQAQADWADCGRFELGGKPITIYAFVMVLSYSRLLFVHFTTSQRLGELIRCHQLAFAYFGGWPKEVLYDNMKQVRIGPGQLNEGLVDFADHHGFAIKTHRPYRPRTKGKVERQVDYVKDNFLAGRSFAGLDALNAQARHWLDHTANARVHATTERVPREAAADETLTPLTACTPYQLAQAVARSVSREALVHYHGSRYSVPPCYVGERVAVSARGGQIQVRVGDTVVAEHRAALKRGQCVVHKDHVAQLWKVTDQQTARPPQPTAPRWHLLSDAGVVCMPLSRFEEVLP